MNQQKSHYEMTLDEAFAKVKSDDIMHRGFLKPIEIALKTYKTETQFNEPQYRQCANLRRQRQLDQAEHNMQSFDLPAGLKLIFKESIDNNKFIFTNVEEVNEVDVKKNVQNGIDPFQVLVDHQQDNLLALMKKQEGIKLAICICMYSEHKIELKRTLEGVSQNIANLVANEGIDPDDIGVFVIMDGIEKVDGSVVEYFQELEKSCNIFLGENSQNPLKNQSLKKQYQKMDEDEINQKEFLDINPIIFDPIELETRQSLRFVSIHQKYTQMKSLLKIVNALSKKVSLSYSDLPSEVKQFYEDQAIKQRKQDFQQSDEDIKRFEEKFIQQHIFQEYKKQKGVIHRALSRAKTYAQQYLATRQDLAYLSFFRKKINFKFEQKQQQNEGEEEKQPLKTEQQLQYNSIEKRQPSEFHQRYPSEHHTFMNLFMCVKYKNQGKLSSHNWFFNGFCKELKPQYAVLMDVGLKPDSEAILKMYKYLDKNKDPDNNPVGGACGYMSLRIQKLSSQEEKQREDVDWLTSLFNEVVDIQKVQQAEYHFAHLIDKAFESVSGFIHVLPGAFSAYNMSSLIDYEHPQQDSKLLRSYFQSIDQFKSGQKIIHTSIGVMETLKRIIFPNIDRNSSTVDSETDEVMLYNQNVYQAEDRILCLGIHQKGFRLVFLPDALATVDSIRSLPDLLGQRKRWINGSYFAFEKVKKELDSNVNQRQDCSCSLRALNMYLTLQNTLIYFGPSFFLLAVHYSMQAINAYFFSKIFCIISDNSNTFGIIFRTLTGFIYVLLLMTLFLLSLNFNAKHQKFKPYINIISTILGLYNLIVVGTMVWDFRTNGICFSFQDMKQCKSFLAISESQNTEDWQAYLVTIFRWTLLVQVFMSVIPVLTYSFLYKQLRTLKDVVFSYFSFMFFLPTYIQILNIYALCRIDDFSWGTKGLDGQVKQDQVLKTKWKIVKYIHVFKFFIWNVLMATFLISMASYYAPKVIIFSSIAALFFLSLVVKVVLGTYYLIAYKIKGYCCGEEKRLQRVGKSRIERLMSSLGKGIQKLIKQNLQMRKKAYLDHHEQEKINTFIYALQTFPDRMKFLRKKKAQQFIEKSKVISKRNKSRVGKRQTALVPIEERSQLMAPRNMDGSLSSLRGIL